MQGWNWDPALIDTANATDTGYQRTCPNPDFSALSPTLTLSLTLTLILTLTPTLTVTLSHIGGIVGDGAIDGQQSKWVKSYDPKNNHLVPITWAKVLVRVDDTA